MNRIDQIFSRLRATGGKALMPFLTVGDPDLATTGRLLPELARTGASICELGFPFSDPIADGPVIQASMAHALAHGLRPAQIFEMVARQRAGLDLGLVAMVSYSIVHRLGLQAFVRDAAAAGIDGLIVPDLSLEQSQPLRDLAGKYNLACSLLIAPTTPPERAQDIARACSGFIYLLARAGITGERSELPADLGQRITRLRQASDLPIAVGFGVAGSAQVAQVVAAADAAIVGSAIMRRIAQLRNQPQNALVSQVAAFVGELAQGLTAPA